jgi:four helix bundle protein
MFHAYQIALDVIASLRSVVPEIRKHDADLTKQMVRAASSITLNLNEGSRRAGLDRKHHYRIAAGSASEVVAVLDTAAAWGWTVSGDPAREKLDHLLAILWKLTQ